MSLVVQVKNANQLRGRYDRIARVTFRDITYQTQVYEDCSDADWDEEFDWPLDGPLLPSEYIEIQVLNHNKIFSNRVVGIFRMVLQRLINEHHLEITDSLVDNNNTVLKAQISLELTYSPPDGSIRETLFGIPPSYRDTYSDSVDGIDTRVVQPGSRCQKISRRGSRMSLPGYKHENGGLEGSLLSLPTPSSQKKVKNNRSGSGRNQHNSSQSEDPAIFNIPMTTQKNTESNQLGVVAGPFGQMLVNKEQLSSRRGSQFSLNSSMGVKDKFHQHPKVRVEARETVKEIDYQVQLRIIEARQLSGMQLDPVCTVTIGNQKKHTAVKEQTNTPFWDEFFVFDFKMAACVLFDKIINFQVFTGRNLVTQGLLIGSFKLDIGTVYAQQDHRFVRRWAVLTDPEETLGASGAGVKGYLKVDITVLGKGDPIKEPPSVKDNEDDIESNLLLPDGVPAERPKARIVCKFYRAEGLPKMNSGLMANVKKAFTGEVRDLVDPYVDVQFAGQRAKTSVKKHTYEPEWNEQITFAELFPPLCRRIRVQLKDGDAVTDDVVGTHFIDLSQISNDGANGFMPTFGPCWVNLYGSTRDFSLFDEHNSLNAGLGEGVGFRGRLLMAVQAEMGDSASDAAIKQVEVEATPPISDTASGKEEVFQLYACIHAANMIERKTADRPIQFEMSIGNHGNTIDGQVVQEQPDPGDKEIIDDRFVQSLTPPCKAVSTDRQYYHLPYEENKPCLHIKLQWQDHRRRLYLSNMLYKLLETLTDNLDDIQERVKMDFDDTFKFLQRTLQELLQHCQHFVSIADGRISGPTIGRTKLDRERNKLCLSEIRQVADQARSVLDSIHDNTHIKENLKMVIEFQRKIQTIVTEPQDGVPDIFIWMLSGGKRVAYARIPAQHVIYSQTDYERGRDAGRLQTVFLRLPGKRGDGPKGWTIQAKLNILIWLGLHKHKKDMLKDAPKGFQMPKGANKVLAPPANHLLYSEQRKFILRAHLYQARSLIGSDASGLSDAFARVVIGSKAADTRVIWETRSPTWDQMIIFNDIVIWGDVNTIACNPPTIVTEIFDKDIGGDSEFIGRALSRPIVKLSHEKYEKPLFPPALEWFEIIRGDERAGELLAAFELLQVVEEGKCFLPEEVEPIDSPDGKILPVPDGIRPIMKKHRIEVLFWGVREMKRVNLTTVDRPQVDADCAGHVAQSTVIVNAKKNPNFANPVAYFDVDLPENERYCPPLTIRVRDCRTFGRFTLVGTHVVNSLHKYLQDPDNYKHLAEVKRTADDSSRPQSPAPKKQAMVELYDDPIDDQENDKDEQLLNEPVSKKRAKSGESSGKKSGDDDEDDEESLDWWSRYYETVKDEEREEEEKKVRENKQSKTNESMKKNKSKNIEDGDIEREKRIKTPNPKITRITIYRQELENITDFNGFNDWLHSFPLYRGKKTSDDDDDEHRIVGKFKGAIKVWKHPLPKFLEVESPTASFFKLPSNEPVNVLIRCYIVRALDLHPTDINGKSDPYVVLTLGKQKMKDRDNYVSKQLNPIFGRVFDFEAIIPMDNMMTVGVYDYDMVGSDDLIGETRIDIENRFYSRHRPTCGLSSIYATFGFNKWRDPMKPTQILARICKDESLDGPHYTAPGKCRVENMIFAASSSITDEAGNTKPSDEPCALKALHHFHRIPKKGFSLVAEHVETRSLYNPEKPGIEQGKIELWVDMFAMDMPSPGAPVEITPRKPATYELRVIIWNTEDVLMDEINLVTGEACSDIYVKGWLEGMKDEKQQTDVHYRSLTGEGNFNWRFVFPFQYQKAEEKIVIKKKANFFSWDESEEKVPSRLTLQVWDADAFSADDFIGDLCLDLAHMPRGAKTAKTCSLDTMKVEKTISIFKAKHIKGWWPFAVNTDLEEIELAGKVEAELELLTQEEAEKTPCGLGREEPQPLEKPNRPDTSFTWFMNPFKSLRYMIWEQYKFCLLKFLVVAMLIALMALFFYSMPGYTVKKIFGA
ncbi:otoferlin-like isoform X4 [Clytia hemisphaerica]|uniref:otoferlin-like isoform X4 n=1 Tax=Clytia hemisphaerica TaxID=252671 RepID=UPI0034D5230E